MLCGLPAGGASGPSPWVALAAKTPAKEGGTQVKDDERPNKIRYDALNGVSVLIRHFVEHQAKLLPGSVGGAFNCTHSLTLIAALWIAVIFRLCWYWPILRGSSAAYVPILIFSSLFSSMTSLPNERNKMSIFLHL
eukprot:1151484-Pelagomonas_calceolata.AAC.4